MVVCAMDVVDSLWVWKGGVLLGAGDEYGWAGVTMVVLGD